MSNWIINGLERLVELIMIGAALAAIVGATLWLLRGPSWVSVLFQLSERTEVKRPLIVSAAVAGALGFLPFGSAGLAAAVLLWLVFAPRYVAFAARQRGWAADDEATKLDALDIRNRLRELRQEEPLTGNTPWPEYLLDVAKAKRQRSYQLRFDRAGGQEPQTSPITTG